MSLAKKVKVHVINDQLDAGFTYAQAMDYIGESIPNKHAQSINAKNIGLRTTKKFLEYFNQTETAWVWAVTSLTVSKAKEWNNMGWSAAEAGEWFNKKFGPMEACTWQLH